MSEPFTLIEPARVSEVQAEAGDGRVLLDAGAVHRALGWELKPEGFCRDGACVPIPGEAEVLDGGAVDLAAFAALLRRPLAMDIERRAAYLGAAADERAEALRSLEAPGFTLPDLDGRPHALAEHRGEKVFLVAWASW